jgi:hypothetical protein
MSRTLYFVEELIGALFNALVLVSSFIDEMFTWALSLFR